MAQIYLSSQIRFLIHGAHVATLRRRQPVALHDVADHD